MKILLMIPPGIFLPGEDYFCTFPLGIAYLGAVLNKNKYEVKIMDCFIEDQKISIMDNGMHTVGTPWKIIKEKISILQPDVVGISNSYSVQEPNVLRLAKIIKESCSAIVVLGGAHPSGMVFEILKDENIDFVIIGEGEESFLELVNSLKDNKSVDKIDGLGYKCKEKIIINSKKRYIKKLDELPFPAWHLFSMNKYLYSRNPHSNFLRRKPYMPIVTSRGCTGNCIFCSIHIVFGYCWRSRSYQNVVDEIEILVNKYGVREIHFEDDNLTFDRQRMLDLCDEIISRKIDIVWTTPNGVHISNLDEELLSKMKESGCYRLFIGIESGNNYVLQKIIRKDISLDEVKFKVELLKKFKIEIVGFFVIGLPGEKKKDIYETINFAKSLDLDDVLFSIATPYPGTDLWELCKSKDILSLDSYTKLRPKCAVISTDLLGTHDVENLRNEAYLKFQIYKFLRHPFRYFFSKENLLTWKRYLRYLIHSFIIKKLNIKKVKK
jgi:magnesium-protoporphyrin IX monomethyl ester (oxidative) cyclase